MIKCQILPGSSFEAVKIRIDLINGATFLTTARLVDLRDKDGEILRCMPSYTIDGLVECVVMRKDTSQATIAYGEHVLRVVANSIVEDSIKDSKGNKMSRVKCRILPNNSFNSTVKIRIDLINGILETRVPINALRTFDGEVLRVADQFTSVCGSMECSVEGITSKSTFIKCANHTLLVHNDSIIEDSIKDSKENKMSRVKCQILWESYNEQTMEIGIKLLSGSTLLTYSPIEKLRGEDGEVLRPPIINGSVECTVLTRSENRVLIEWNKHTLFVAPDQIVKELTPTRVYLNKMHTLDGYEKAFQGSWKNKQNFAVSQIEKQGLIDPKFVKLDEYAEALFNHIYWCVEHGNGIWVFKVVK